MRLLVTGAAGFIGSYVAGLAVERGYEVHGVDLAEAPAIAVAGFHHHRMCEGQEGFESIIEEIRPVACIHAAGRASVYESVANPALDFASGPVLTFALLDELRRHAPECRALFLSSAAVYGNPEKLPVGEDAPAAPISPYGFHKRQSELLCREFTDVYGMKTAVARIFSAYGEGLRRQVLWDICRKSLMKGGFYCMALVRRRATFYMYAILQSGSCKSWKARRWVAKPTIWQVATQSASGILQLWQYLRSV